MVSEPVMRGNVQSEPVMALVFARLSMAVAWFQFAVREWPLHWKRRQLQFGPDRKVQVLVDQHPIHHRFAFHCSGAKFFATSARVRQARPEKEGLRVSTGREAMAWLVSLAKKVEPKNGKAARRAGRLCSENAVVAINGMKSLYTVNIALPQTV
jgi:hypothetical protein